MAHVDDGDCPVNLDYPDYLKLKCYKKFVI